LNYIAMRQGRCTHAAAAAASDAITRPSQAHDPTK
jgi:hypothetical protein